MVPTLNDYVTMGANDSLSVSVSALVAAAAGKIGPGAAQHHGEVIFERLAELEAEIETLKTGKAISDLITDEENILPDELRTVAARKFLGDINAPLRAMLAESRDTVKRGQDMLKLLRRAKLPSLEAAFAYRQEMHAEFEKKILAALKNLPDELQNMP